ncbi:MAG: hypothetical protein FK733_11985 [Asgard group archaeon]|nr:hypothetical protein [Asgard group archaeon]
MSSSKIKPFLLISLFLLSPIIVNVSSIVEKEEEFHNTPNAVENWTVMLYFCADTRSSFVTSSLNNSGNGLYIDMLGTFNSLNLFIDPNSDNDINVIALFDSPWTSQDPYGNARLYEIKGNNPILLNDYGSINMGDQQTLEDFINYCKTNYPATYYSLTLVDHGRGYAGFCYDYHAAHPYWAYALGDCLTVQELDSALENTGGVDVLFLDTCSGGSFEVMWQLIDEVDYVIAGESLQWNNALYHSAEICYNLSRNVNYTPYQLANCGFDCARNIQVAPWDQTGNWKSISFYDLTKFDSISTSQTFQEVFSDFTDILIAEFSHNSSGTRDLIWDIRSDITSDIHFFSTESMMVDFYIFVDALLERYDEFYFNDTIFQIATELLLLLTPGVTKTVIKEWNYPWYGELYGYSICIPDNYNMYQGYLYPNFYEDLDISLETNWDEFLKLLYPIYDFDPQRYEFWEFKLDFIDPSVSLHVLLKFDPLRDPLHVGLNEFSTGNMGIELGIPGSEFYDDLLFGNSIIRIPASGLSEFKNKDPAEDDIAFTVVVNATAAASATQDVNLTVRHVINQSTVWQSNKISDFKLGQTLICEVSINEEITDFEILNSPFERTILGLPLKWFTVIVISSVIVPVVTIVIIVVLRRKKK